MVELAELFPYTTMYNLSKFQDSRTVIFVVIVLTKRHKKTKNAKKIQVQIFLFIFFALNGLERNLKQKKKKIFLTWSYEKNNFFKT